MSKPKIEVLPIKQAATPDLNNINKHTQRGRGLHENSMRKRGAGRSIFSAGKGVDLPVVMGGNQTLEIAATLGMEVINVHTTGNTIVNVVRDDIVPGSPEFYALALEDNYVANVSYNPDIDILAAVMADPAMQALKAEDKMLADIVEGMGGKQTASFIGGSFETPAADGEQVPLSQIKMVQLFFTVETVVSFNEMCMSLSKIYGTKTLTDTVMKGIQNEYDNNQ